MAGVSWAAEVDLHEQQTSGPSRGADVAPKVRVAEQPKDDISGLPEIPENFDIETYDPPMPVSKENPANNTITKYSWDIVCDPTCDKGVENPPMVVQQTIEVFKVERMSVNKAIASRRHFAKYGNSVNDPDGPNNGTTNMAADDVPISFTHKRGGGVKTVEGDNQVQQVSLDANEEEELRKLKQNMVAQLSFHNLIGPNIGLNKTRPGMPDMPGPGGPAPGGAGGTSFMDRVLSRGGDARGADGDRPSRPGMPGRGNRMDAEGSGVRVTNLSENVTDGDIHDLFAPCGRILRVYLAREKRTGKAKGFAYVTYADAPSAEKAIRTLNKHPYDHLILSVEWSKSDKQ